VLDCKGASPKFASDGLVAVEDSCDAVSVVVSCGDVVVAEGSKGSCVVGVLRGRII
jgi:hypothetical protein